MASITICPRCTSHLELPPGADPVAQVQCPICEVEFSLATVSPRELPQARLVELVDFVEPVETTEAETEESFDAAYQDADPVPKGLYSPSDAPHLGASRLDQLLADLIKTPAEPAPATREAAEAPNADDFVPDLSTDYETDEDEEDEVVISSLGEAAAVAAEPLDLRTTPRRKRRPAGLRTLVGVVGGGALGLLLGAYGLLWLKGPAGDFAGLSQWLPPAMLPSSLKSMADASDDDAAAASEERSELTAADEPPMLDAAVTPATAVEPTVANAPPRDDTAPPREWPTSPVVGDLRDVQLYSVAEVDELLDAADAAHRQFLAGDLARQESWSTMGPAYIALAALAERYTLTDPAEFGNELIAQQIAAKNIFRGIAGDPARRGDLATIAARWLQHERRQNNGVVLIGRVRDLRPSGKWTEYVIDVPLGESTVAANVLLDGTGFATGDEVAVVGAIVPRPQEQLAGYRGDAAQVVVAGYAFTPEEFVAPKPTADSGLLPLEPGAAAE